MTNKINKRELHNIIHAHLQSFYKQNPLPDEADTEDLSNIFKEIGQHFSTNSLVYNYNFEHKIIDYKQNLKIDIVNYKITSDIQKKALTLLSTIDHFCMIPAEKYHSSNFTNGNYYISHSKKELDFALEKILSVCYSLVPSLQKKIDEGLASKNITHQYDPKVITYVHRIFEESSELDHINSTIKSILCAFLEKLHRINYEHSREYGQIYYALNPHEVTVCANIGGVEKKEAAVLNRATTKKKNKQKIL